MKRFEILWGLPKCDKVSTYSGKNGSDRAVQCRIATAFNLLKKKKKKKVRSAKCCNKMQIIPVLLQHDNKMRIATELYQVFTICNS